MAAKKGYLRVDEMVSSMAYSMVVRKAVLLDIATVVLMGAQKSLELEYYYFLSSKPE